MINKMINKEDRETKELKSCIKDPKTVREFWRSLGQSIAMRPAVRIPSTFDKNGEETLNSLIESYSYKSLANDIHKVQDSKNTEPTELELMLQCQMVRARYDTSAATFIRDTIGAKPVDESKVDTTINNPYESLSDEELELIAKHRASKEAISLEPVSFDVSVEMYENNNG